MTPDVDVDALADALAARLVSSARVEVPDWAAIDPDAMYSSGCTTMPVPGLHPMLYWRINTYPRRGGNGSPAAVIVELCDGGGQRLGSVEFVIPTQTAAQVARWRR